MSTSPVSPRWASVTKLLCRSTSPTKHLSPFASMLPAGRRTSVVLSVSHATPTYSVPCLLLVTGLVNFTATVLLVCCCSMLGAIVNATPSRRLTTCMPTWIRARVAHAGPVTCGKQLDHCVQLTGSVNHTLQHPSPFSKTVPRFEMCFSPVPKRCWVENTPRIQCKKVSPTSFMIDLSGSTSPRFASLARRRGSCATRGPLTGAWKASSPLNTAKTHAVSPPSKSTRAA